MSDNCELKRLAKIKTNPTIPIRNKAEAKCIPAERSDGLHGPILLIKHKVMMCRAKS